MESSPIDDTIREQIIKYGTIAIDTLIELIIPFLPPFIDKQDVRSIAILLLSVITPAAFLGGAVFSASVISDIAIFGCKTATEITKFGVKAVYYTGKTTLKAVASTAVLTTDLLIKKPFYLISYPFRRQSPQHQGLINAITKREAKDNREELERFKTMHPKDSSKVFLVIRKIQAGSQKISLRMVGNLAKEQMLGTIINYLKQKDVGIDSKSIQFVCNRNLVNINTKVSELAKNEYGFVDLYYTEMESFG